jgi:hypothetical protein
LHGYIGGSDIEVKDIGKGLRKGYPRNPKGEWKAYWSGKISDKA